METSINSDINKTEKEKEYKLLQLLQKANAWLYEKHPNIPVIVAGDLSSQPQSASVGYYMESMFVDLQNVAHPDSDKYSIQTQQIRTGPNNAKEQIY